MRGIVRDVDESRGRVPRNPTSWLCRLGQVPVADFVSFVVKGAPGSVMCQLFFVVLFLWCFGGCCAFFVINSPVVSCFHGNRLLSYCTVGHTTGLAPASLSFDHTSIAFSFY